MKCIHIICKRDDGINLNGLTRDSNTGNYRSIAWDIPLQEATQLIAGRIFLHESKSRNSEFGGIVLRVFEVLLDEDDTASRKNRVGFEFKATADSKHQPWKGKSHGMAWNSGIIDY